MTWIIIAYLLVLVFLSANRTRFPDRLSLRLAWTWFALIPISHFVFAIFQATNIRDPRDLALVEIWSNGFEWLLLGVSMIFLKDVIASTQSSAPPVQG